MASSSSSSSPEISHLLPEPSETLDDVLEELSTRFIMNLPDQELESVERMCFQVEQAHWYYEDFMREANPKLPSFNLKKFSSLFFNSCPLLRQWSAEHEQYFNTFMQYKVRVPVCGAIMLNDKWDKCILVKGWKSSAGWGFPKGKINQNEPPHECAAREVAEETGFNISSYLCPDDYIEMTIREQRVTLFIVGGIPEDYPFQPRTRKEISKIQWFKLSDLPSWKRNKQALGKFYLISPFVHALKEFIRVNRPTRRRQNRRNSVNESIPELAIRTTSEVKDVTENTEPRDHHVPRAVSLDRDTNGYSSSSVDNGEPHTPSPQSSEALPVGTEVYKESKSEPPMDPHFARLLNGLTLSASKPDLKEEDTRANSITPTSAQSSLSSTRGDYANTPRQPTNEEYCSSHGGATNDVASTSCTMSPSDSGRSDSSIMTVRPQSVQPLSSATTFAPDRHLKHLALLEIVAQEAAASTTMPSERQQNHPGQPSSVPPLMFNPPRPMSILGPNARAFNGGHNATVSNVSGQLVPPYVNDHHMIRPMTSQSLYPQPPVLHHGSNTNLQQGSLLSILCGTGNPTQGLQRFVGRPESWNGQGNLHRTGGSIPPVSVPPIQPLRVIPPPARGSFQINPGPLTAPLVPPGRPFFDQHGNYAVPNPHKATASNAAHLLSLLNSNSGTPSIVTTDRPNYQQGPTY